MIPKILCPLNYVGIDYIFPVLQALGSDVDVMVTQSHINNHGPLLVQLEQAGVRFLPQAEHLYANYRYVFAEYHYLTPPFTDQLREAGCLAIAYIHATDTALPQLERCQFFLAHSETVLRQCDDKTQLLLNGECACFARSEDGQAEAATVGLFHLGAWETLRHTPRAQLKQELLDALAPQSTINPALPLVIYYEDEYNDPASVMRGLRRLAEHCTVLVKPWTDALNKLKGPNIIHFGGQGPRLWSAFLPRFAADAVLSGAFSGVGSTSVMLGLPYIPVYSQELLNSNNNMAPLGNVFAFYDKHLPQNTRCRILSRIAPLHLEDTATLLKRIHDKAYWHAYNIALPQWQQEIFGHYRLEGAAQYAASLLRSILLRGSMIPPSLQPHTKDKA